MPNRPPHPCPRHSWVLVPHGAGCPLCAGQPALERQHVPSSDTRPNAGRRGYDSKWQKYSKEYLAEHPYCACGCGRKSKLVDHIIPVNGQNDPLFWDPSNHQALSWTCHNRKGFTDGSRQGMGGQKSMDNSNDRLG
jgi:5-methylcytosine-specific restriction protein A